ncbi:MAG TPA: hypothetical protein VK702_13070 [Candidatus Acidoferrum sp.]|jgi:hypothetical protein|nr:hypothetical protein [Candidatus Acidoferrum sp.]
MRALALLLALAGAVLALPVAAATPSPKATAAAHYVPPVPKVAEHTEFVVEVNAKGQVVRVKTAKGTGAKDPIFNAQTYGNVLQMWIRHPDGSAEVGLYRVTYDFNPVTKKVRRGVALVQPGGDWGNQPGAATEMIDTANREYQDAVKAQQAKEQAQNKNLPPLDTIVAPSSSPTHHP